MEKKKLKSILVLCSKGRHEEILNMLRKEKLRLTIPEDTVPYLSKINDLKGKNKLLLYDNWNIEKRIANIRHVSLSKLEKPMGSIFPNINYISLRGEYNPLEIYQLIKSKYYFS